MDFTSITVVVNPKALPKFVTSQLPIRMEETPWICSRLSLDRGNLVQHMFITGFSMSKIFLKILKRWDSGCTICMPKRRKCLKNTTKLAFSLTTCFLLPQQVQPLVQLHQSENLDPFIMTPSSLYCYTCSSGFPHPWCISAVDNSYGEELHCYRSVSKLVMTD